MRWLYRQLVRPLLFTQSPEAIHDRTLAILGWLSGAAWRCRVLAGVCRAPELPVERFGLRFPNPVGLAAGMDKKGEAVAAWEAMGFGHVELGGVTALAQPGNEPPRVFRAVSQEAVVNRMGFNNPGAESVARTLTDWKRRGRWPTHPVGMNLGKSKVTPLEEAAADYARSFHAMRDLVDFFVVNVSSPNTPNLRQLQDKAALDEILAALQEANSGGAGGGGGKPILVKVAPDLSFEALDEILELVKPRSLAGIVATNTTVTRPEVKEAAAQRAYAETGGLSGRPLRSRSTEVIRHLYRQSKGAVPIIGVGGIHSGADAWEKVLAGACLLQVYTGLVFEGPTLVRRVVRDLRERLRSHGLRGLDEAVGQSDNLPSASG